MSSAAASDARPISRTIAVTTTDTLRFNPDQINVRAGETVAFEITNAGALPHEFFIGTPAEQQAHEAEISGGAAMMQELQLSTYPPEEQRDSCTPSISPAHWSTVATCRATMPPACAAPSPSAK